MWLLQINLAALIWRCVMIFTPKLKCMTLNDLEYLVSTFCSGDACFVTKMHAVMAHLRLIVRLFYMSIILIIDRSVVAALNL